MRKYSENIKATFFLGIASFLTSGINYLTTPFFTRILSTSEYGLISKYNSVYLIISVIATLTLSRPGILSVGLYEHKENRWKYLSTMLGEVLVSTVLSFALLGVLWNSIRSIINIPFSLILLIFVSCAVQPAMTFWTYKQRYEYKWKTTFAINVGTAILAQAVSIVAVIWFKKRGSANLGQVRLFSAAAVNLFASAFIYILIILKGKRFFDLVIWKKSFLFAIPLIPHYLGFALLTGTDKIMIGYMLGDDQTGIYSLAAIISTIGVLIWQALCVSITPFVYESLGKRDLKKIDALTKPLLELVGLFCIAISFLSPEIIAILGTEEYLDAAYVVPAAAAGTFLHVLYDLFSNVAFFYKKSVHIMIATMAAALINIVLNYFCIQKYGYIAAGYTTLFSYLALAVFHYGISRRLEPEKIFNWKYDAALSAIVILACLSSMFVYKINLLRYFTVLLLFVIVIVRRKKYISALGEMRV